MAHIFKKAINNKGILVFTHKEKPFIENHPIVKDLKNKYFIGIHYGHRLLNQRVTIEDFCMGKESTIYYDGKQSFRIPFNSRGFLPSFFRNMIIPKFYDIMCVARNIHLKNLNIFLDSVRKIYDLGLLYKFLLIVPTAENENANDSFLDIVDQYNQRFSRKERELFTLIRLSKEHGFLGISPLTIAYLMNSSKAFTLLSPGEGESRVIHEALLCGLPIICYNQLYGGGLDYLNEKNSVQFSDYKNVYKAFIECVENYGKYEIDNNGLAEELREDKTIPKLKEYFKQLYSESNKTFDDNLINIDELHLRLPAHYLDVSWRGPVTADIQTSNQLDLFLKELNS